MLLALFEGRVGTLPCTHLVFSPAETKGFAYVSFAISKVDNIPGARCYLSILAASSDLATTSKDFATFFRQLSSLANDNFCSYVKSTATLFTKEQLFITKKINNLKVCPEFNSKDFKFLDLNDKDSNGVLLKDYLEETFTVENVLQDFKKSKTPIRKWGYPSMDLDTKRFWESTNISDDVKAYCTPVLDPDLLLSWQDSFQFKSMHHAIHTEYADTFFKLFILSGPPAGGKSTFAETLAAYEHLPFIKIPADPNTTVQKLLTSVAPILIDGDVKLTRQHSPLGLSIDEKCPVVVCFEEFNYMPTSLTSIIADFITSGRLTAGTETFATDISNIIWIVNYNPKSKHQNEFDDKFTNRGIFYWFDEIPFDTRWEYLMRKTMALNYPCSAELKQSYQDKFALLKEKNPSLVSRLDDFSSTFFSYIDCKKPSSVPALDNLIKIFEDNANGVRHNFSFKENEFTDYHTGDFSPVSESDSSAAFLALGKYVKAVTEELTSMTTGIDTSNSNRHSRLTIENRGQEHFIDTILALGNTLEATRTWIVNRIPGDFVCKSSLSNERTKDVLPTVIADAICTKVERLAEETDIALFSNISMVDIDEYKKWLTQVLSHTDVENLSTSGVVEEPEPEVVEDADINNSSASTIPNNISVSGFGNLDFSKIQEVCNNCRK